MNDYDFKKKTNFIWSIGNLLRGDYKPHENGKVILPLTVLRRLDCVLNDSKKEFLQRVNNGEHIKLVSRQMGLTFYNTSKFDFSKLKDDSHNIALNLVNYIDGFSDNAKEILDCFNFSEQIDRLEKSNLLYLIVSKFATIDLHPNKVSNLEMGYIFEELIRKFSEQSNEDAGEHFSPREVIRLMVNLLLNEDKEILTKEGIVRTLYDPAAGTGGMLSVAQEYLAELNPSATLNTFGQELNPESYAICKADMMIKGENPSNIHKGNSFSSDGFPDEKFDYMLSNPPFGVEWKKVETEIKDEFEQLGFAGRFGAGLPRIDNGSFLFLQHMISKMKTNGDGSRIAVVYNGGTLFVADHASGENNIRRWIIENDWLEAIVALPNQLFYNAKFYTYVWIVSNKKSEKRKGKVQLIDATKYFEKMKTSLGEKRNKISIKQIAQITNIYSDFNETNECKIVNNEELAFKQFTINTPQRRNYGADEDRIETLLETKAYHSLFKKISDTASIEFFDILRTLPQDKVYKSKKEFEQNLKDAINNANLGYPIPPAMLDKIIYYLSESDDTAEIYRDIKGEVKIDQPAQIKVMVPADTDIMQYFEDEFKADYPDSWVEEDKIKLCYLINYNKYFFEARNIEDINEVTESIQILGQQIQNEISAVCSEHISERKAPPAATWLDELPDDWSATRFKNITSSITAGYTSTPEYVDEDEGVAFFSAQNIHDGKLDLSKYNFITKELHKKLTKYTKPRKGDLLQVRVGNNNTMCETCVVDQDMDYAVYSSAAHIRVKDDAHNEYVKFLCNSSNFRDEANMIMKTGVGVANLNITDLANIKIPIPPHDEQVDIANFLTRKTEQIDDVISTLENQIANLKKLKASVMAKSITGRIIIPKEGD